MKAFCSKALISVFFIAVSGCAQMSARYFQGSGYEKALYLYENGELLDAKAKAESVGKDNRDYRSARRLIGDINSASVQISRRHMELAEEYERAGIYTKAVEEYKEALRFNPSNRVADERVEALTEAMREGEAGSIRKRLAKKEEKEDPEYLANLHYLKGKLYFDSKAWGKAMDEFTAALKYVPEYMNTDELLVKARKERDWAVDQHIKNGIAHFRAEEMELAIKEWDFALELEPSNKTAADYRYRAQVILERLRSIREKKGNNGKPPVASQSVDKELMPPF